MAKKQSAFNPAAGLFTQVQPPAPAPAPATPRQANEPQADLVQGTQGRKGHKLPRINMAFTPENHAFLKAASRREGVSITEFVNRLVDASRRGE